MDILSKQNSKILRGLAILAIVLHNFLHLEQFGLSAENEMSFSAENALAFFDSIGNGHFMAQLFSFLGWVGVPAFVFLTGYGSAMSLPPINSRESAIYIKKNFLKLFLLMFPAVMFFVVGDVLQHNIWPQLAKRASYLTLLANFVYPWVKCSPGVYWYFGLTFQYYLLWALFGRYMNGRNLLGWSIAALLGTYVLSLFDLPDALSVYRHCFTGWFFIFALGVWMAKNKDVVMSKMNFPWWGELLLMLLMAVLVVMMNKWLTTWLFVPLAALAFFFFAGKLILRLRPLASVFGWIGGLSACIFVAHPIARTFIIRLLKPHVSNLLLLVLAFLILSVLLAMIYDKLYTWLKAKIMS